LLYNFVNVITKMRMVVDVMKRILVIIAWSLASLCFLGAQGTGGVVMQEKGKGMLSIYTPHEAGPVTASVKEFQEKTGIRVHVVFAGTGQLLDRIRKETKNGVDTCDILWGGGAESVAANTDLFSPYISTVDDLIPSNDKDEKHLWTGESPVPVVIAYNPMLVGSDEVPHCWKDLLDPKWKGRIAFASPLKSGSAYTLLCTMLIALGWDGVEGFVKNLDGKLSGSSAEVYQSVADGQFAVGLTQEKVVQSLIQEGKNIAISYPREGTVAVDDSIALVKGAKHMKEAKEFIEFVLSKPNQMMMASLFNRRPVRTDLNPPEGLPPMSGIKLFDYDVTWASGNKQEILERWAGMVPAQ